MLGRSDDVYIPEKEISVADENLVVACKHLVAYLNEVRPIKLKENQWYKLVLGFQPKEGINMNILHPQIYLYDLDNLLVEQQ